MVTEYDGNYEDDVQWLKNNTSSWLDVCDKWTPTTEYRTSKFLNENIHAYIQKFPALQEPVGYTLFSIDFSTLFPHSKNLLFAKWTTIFPKILRIANLKSDSFIKSVLNDEYELMKTDDNRNSSGNVYSFQYLYNI